MKLKSILKDIVIIICILLIAAPFLFFGLDLFKDFWRNRSLVIFFTIIQEKSREIHSFYKAIDQIMRDHITIPGHFFKISNMGLIGMTMNMILVNVFKKIMDLSVKNLTLVSSFIGIATIILTYLFSRKIYNRKTGFISAVLMSCSLIFVFTTRNTFLIYPYTIETFLSLITIFTFWLAHTKTNYKYLLITGLSIGLSWVNGIIAPFVCIFPIIFIGFYLISKIKFFHLFKLKIYLYMFLLSFGVFLSISIIYSLYIYASPLEIVNFINRYFLSRSMEATQHNLTGVIYNFARFFVILFYGSIPGSRFDFTDGFGTYYWPLINPFVGLFLFIGVYKCFKSKKLADIIIFIWLLATIFVFTFLTYFEARYINSVLPAIFIIASIGIVHLSEIVSKYFSVNFKRLLSVNSFILIFSIITIVSSIYITTNAFFIDRYQNDGYFLENYGQVQAGDYIYKNSSYEDCFVVLNDEVTTLESIFVFATRGKPYQHIFWNVLNNGEINIQEWEKEILQYKNKIYYIFSHGPDFIKEKVLKFYKPADWNYFKKIHPLLKPAKIIYSAMGMPVLSIYEVSQNNIPTKRSNNLLKKKYLSSFNNSSFENWNNGVPISWSANSLSSFSEEKKIVYDGKSCIKVSTANSSGRLEQEITNWKDYIGKTLTLKAVIRRDNNASVGISIYDGLNELSSGSKWALGHFGTVSLIKTIPKDAKCLKIFLNVNSCQSTAYFDQVELYEGY